MPLSRALPHAALLLALVWVSHVQADDLKDISQLANQGQQAAALDRINTYLGANPKDVQAIFIKGVILAEQNRRDEAIKVFTELTEKYPNLPEPYNNLAVLYADQGQYDKARKALETAIRTHPSYATAHENLGDIYARMASEAYDKALQLDNGNTRTQNKLSLIKELFSTSTKPLQLASKSVITREPSKENVQAPAVTPVLPVRPTESITPHGAKPIVPKSMAPKVTAPNPVESKPAEPKPAAPKATEAEKVVDAPKPAKEIAANNSSKQITAAVQDWAKAWSSKKVDRYLASYADNFKTPNGETRKDWEQLRRDRISRPAGIQVDITKIRIKMEGDDEARVSFRQSYRSGSLTKRTAKTLTMEKNRDKWLIRQESTGD